MVGILTQHLRAMYYDNTVENQSIQACFNHSLNLDNVSDYRTDDLYLRGEEEYVVDHANFVYLTSNICVTVIINGTEVLKGCHFSYVQKDTSFNMVIRNEACTVDAMSNRIQIFHGLIEEGGD